MLSLLTSLINLWVVAPVVAYAAFFFVAEQPNPFTRPKAPMRRARWRFGRHIGAAFLVGTLCAAALKSVAGLTLVGVALVVAVVTLPICLWAWWSYRKRSAVWEYDESRA